MSNYYLYHHGVKGMRWGVRKDVSKGVSEAANESSKAFARIAGTTRKNKKVKDMSDEELNKIIRRQELEQRYSNLNPSAVSRGATRASNILATIGSIAATGASIAAIAIAIKGDKKDS